MYPGWKAAETVCTSGGGRCPLDDRPRLDELELLAERSSLLTDDEEQQPPIVAIDSDALRIPTAQSG